MAPQFTPMATDLEKCTELRRASSKGKATRAHGRFAEAIDGWEEASVWLVHSY